MRTLALTATLAATLATAAPEPAPAQGEEGVTIVMMLHLAEGISHAAALNSTGPVIERIREQPGLIDETLLAGSTANAPDYVHVMRWERQEDWEALFEDQAFLDLLRTMEPGFEPSAAEVYMPVR